MTVESALHGRRKGHALSDRRLRLLAETLPRLRVAMPSDGEPLDPRRLYSNPVDGVWLEIGFGAGEHLAAMAERHPTVGFIGCEAFVNGVATLLATIEERSLPNIRIHDGDAAELLDRLAPASLGRAYLLYPDPWPKRRHNKRRFVSDARLGALSRALQPGALFRFASDIDDYAGWTLAHVARRTDLAWTAERAADWLEPWEGWEPTRYEQKAVREGRRPTYLTFQRR